MATFGPYYIEITTTDKKTIFVSRYSRKKQRFSFSKNINNKKVWKTFAGISSCFMDMMICIDALIRRADILEFRIIDITNDNISLQELAKRKREIFPINP